ncbi:MAG TPA: hypothetical protein VIH79_01315 [Candidatus Nanopelagicaceae bacterium]
MTRKNKDQRKLDGNLQPHQVHRRWLVTLVGSRRHRVASTDGIQTVAVSLLGGAHVDMSAVTDGTIDLVVISFIGGTSIWLPKGSSLDLSAFVALGGSNDESESLQGDALVKARVRVFSLIGGVQVRTGSPT